MPVGAQQPNTGSRLAASAGWSKGPRATLPQRRKAYGTTRWRTEASAVMRQGDANNHRWRGKCAGTRHNTIGRAQGRGARRREAAGRSAAGHVAAHAGLRVGDQGLAQGGRARAFLHHG
ncbi:hypothetical protein ZWY2020_023108 [Hordeum vulgare]|nr:hypothetical protein ZWY2020_023108 [Hordeum vulgare]